MGGCIASDRITVDGRQVGSMSRESPQNPADSGWVFLSGDEPQEYLDDPNHLAIYEVNTIANYDPTIIPFLYALPGQRFDRVAGRLVEAPDSVPDTTAAGLPAGWTVVQGRVSIAEKWSLELPVPFRRRLEDGDHVLWRPGLTLWINPAKDVRGSIEDRLNHLRGSISLDATEVRSEEHGSLTRLTYRLREDSDDRRVALYGFVLSRTGHLQVAAYFDREEDVLDGRAVVESIRQD
jgi:hypothetical protein